jgi:hypothetical protein
MIEISITIKDSERTLTKRFPEYDPILFDRNNERLCAMVDEVTQEFKGNTETDSPDIIIKSKMTW